METHIKFCGEDVVLLYDTRYNLAWGINWRGSKEPFSPEHPGIYEGGHKKPINKIHNKWCARECERSTMVINKACPNCNNDKGIDIYCNHKFHQSMG